MRATSALDLLALTQDSLAQPAASGGGWTWVLPWLALAGLAGLAAVLILLQRVARAVEAIGDQGRQAGAQIESLHASLARFAATREDLDLRRLEHLLVDLRDQGARTEDTLLRAVQTVRGATDGPVAGEGPQPSAAAWIERIENRLMSLGYSQVQVCLDRDQLETLDESSQSEPVAVPVEATRRDVLHKGCVRIRLGRIVDVELNPPFAMFP